MASNVLLTTGIGGCIILRLYHEVGGLNFVGVWVRCREAPILRPHLKETPVRPKGIRQFRKSLHGKVVGKQSPIQDTHILVSGRN